MRMLRIMSRRILAIENRHAFGTNDESMFRRTHMIDRKIKMRKLMQHVNIQRFISELLEKIRMNNNENTLQTM